MTPAEKRLLAERTLGAFDGNRGKAAKYLKINRKTLYRWLNGAKSKDLSSRPLKMREISDWAVRAALNHFGGHRRKAAESLGISESTLYRLLRKLLSK